MEPLLLAAAFSFSLSLQPAELKISEKDLTLIGSQDTVVENQSSIRLQLRPENPEIKVKRISVQPNFSPSIKLRSLNWINPEIAEKYDPRLSLNFRRSESRNVEALILLTMPL